MSDEIEDGAYGEDSTFGTFDHVVKCMACGDIDPIDDGTNICSRCKCYKDHLNNDGTPHKPYEIPEHVKVAIAAATEACKEDARRLKNRERAWLLYTQEERDELIYTNTEDEYWVIEKMCKEDDHKQWQERVKAAEFAKLPLRRQEAILAKPIVDESKRLAKEASQKLKDEEKRLKDEEKAASQKIKDEEKRLKDEEKAVDKEYAEKWRIYKEELRLYNESLKTHTPRQLSNRQLREQNVPADGICPKCNCPVDVSANWIGNGVLSPMICRNCYNDSQRKGPLNGAIN